MTYLTAISINLLAATPSPATPTGASNITNSATYTLVGAFIAAIASFCAVTLKYIFDGRAEQARHMREMEKLKLEQESNRTEKLRDVKRQASVDFLSTSHSTFNYIRTARRRRLNDEIDNIQYAAALRNAPSEECQTALELLRLVSNQNVTQQAEMLWQHLRSHPFLQSTDIRGRNWITWKEEYWKMRQTLSESCRADITN